MFGVFILFLLALMWVLVRRFYQMYRAERVLRKRGQMEGTEMPEMGRVVDGGGGEGEVSEGMAFGRVDGLKSAAGSCGLVSGSSGRSDVR